MRRLLVVFAVLVATLTFVTVVSAQTQGSCSNPGEAGNGGTVRVWENVYGDTSDGNDSLWLFCHANAPIGSGDLRNILFAFAPANGCHTTFPNPGTTWNDCIDTATVWLPSSLWRVCFYRDIGYGRLSYWVQGPTAAVWSLPAHDDISSVILVNDGHCP